MQEGRERVFEISSPAALQLRKLAAHRRSRSVVLLNGAGECDMLKLTAEIARATDRPVRRAPLSRIVSRYIGETEKNLARRLVIAERDGDILLFDEADALFGRRSEVRDGHDRHANQQAGHLLALLEQYEGIVLLATKHRIEVPTDLGRFLYWVIET